MYISETLSESDSRKIIDNTIFKVLFVKAPNKPMEVRIIQFTPTLNYLKNKNFDLSNLSFKDYTKEFKGDFMIFDFDNNFKKGYHFANDGIKTIKLQTIFLNKNNTANVPLLDVTTTSSSDLCDNSIEIESNCWYNVHITYETICTGGWNLDEGFNPNYCHIEIVSIYCELAYCDNTIDFENCLNQGNTQEQCLCILYEIGCGESGGDENGQCNMTEAEALDILNAVTPEAINIVSSSEMGTPSNPDQENIIRAPKPSTGGGVVIPISAYGGNYRPQWEASYSAVVYKNTSIPNSDWKWESFVYSSFNQTGGAIPLCFTVKMQSSAESVVFIANNTVASASGIYTADVSIHCLLGFQEKVYTGPYSCSFIANN